MGGLGGSGGRLVGSASGSVLETRATGGTSTPRRGRGGVLGPRVLEEKQDVDESSDGKDGREDKGSCRVEAEPAMGSAERVRRKCRIRAVQKRRDNVGDDSVESPECKNCSEY